MDGPIPFAIAVALVLVAPGPTNALLAASGARRGLVVSLDGLVVVLLAYAISIGVFAFLAAPYLRDSTVAALLVRFAAGLYLGWLGMQLWRSADRPGSEAESPVRPAGVFVATLLNPKGPVIGLALLPPAPGWEIAPYLGVTLLCIAASGVLWILAGHAFAMAAPRLATRRLVGRASGVAMFAFAGALLASAAAVLIPPSS
jgi:threonine/homoserine/homoserine lactone efflux protein